jgi:hypothetical protein
MSPARSLGRRVSTASTRAASPPTSTPEGSFSTSDFSAPTSFSAVTTSVGRLGGAAGGNAGRLRAQK